MTHNITDPIRESYDRIADEYARRIFNELQHKPLDRQLLNRFAAEVGIPVKVNIGSGGNEQKQQRSLAQTSFANQEKNLHADVRWRSAGCVTKVIAQGLSWIKDVRCKREPGMFATSDNIIRLGSSLHHLLIQGNTCLAVRSYGRCCGDSHT